MLPFEPPGSRGTNWRIARSIAPIVICLDVDRAERAPAANSADLERQDEVARILAEAELLVERERLQVRAQDEVRGASGSQVLDHGLDERTPGSLAAAALDDVEVTDPADVLLEPGRDEAEHLAVLLGEEQRVRRQGAFELGAVRIPAGVGPPRWGRAVGLPQLPEPLNGFEVVVCAVADGHAGGKRRRPVRR